MKSPLKLILLILLPGCIIMINENNYRSLDAEDKLSVKPFHLETFDQVLRNGEGITLHEINSNDIKSCLSKHQYTWVHLWRPYCSAKECENLGYYASIEDSLKTFDLNILIVSNSYDLDIIAAKKKYSNYNKPLFVLQDSYYGHKLKKSSLKLFNDLNQDSTLISRFGFDDYLFKDSVLIFVGNLLKKQKIDSLITKS